MFWWIQYMSQNSVLCYTIAVHKQYYKLYFGRSRVYSEYSENLGNNISCTWHTSLTYCVQILLSALYTGNRQARLFGKSWQLFSVFGPSSSLFQTGITTKIHVKWTRGYGWLRRLTSSFLRGLQPRFVLPLGQKRAFSSNS